MAREEVEMRQGWHVRQGLRFCATEPRVPLLESQEVGWSGVPYEPVGRIHILSDRADLDVQACGAFRAVDHFPLTCAASSPP